jgi:hypothetical protein
MKKANVEGVGREEKGDDYYVREEKRGGNLIKTTNPSRSP